MMKDLFGLQADGVKLTVNLDTTDGPSNVLASVSGGVSGGKFTNVHLNIDMADFSHISFDPLPPYPQVQYPAYPGFPDYGSGQDAEART